MFFEFKNWLVKTLVFFNTRARKVNGLFDKLLWKLR